MNKWLALVISEFHRSNADYAQPFSFHSLLDPSIVELALIVPMQWADKMCISLAGPARSQLCLTFSVWHSVKRQISPTLWAFCLKRGRGLVLASGHPSHSIAQLFQQWSWCNYLPHLILRVKFSICYNPKRRMGKLIVHNRNLKILLKLIKWN